MTKIIVTGATGFVGRNLIPELVKHFRPENILSLVWSHQSKFENSGIKILKECKVLQKRVDLVTGHGLGDLNFIPDIVIHLAAQTDTSAKNHSVNYLGTKNLYDCLKLNKNTHFIHISTMVLTVGRTDCSTPIDESTPDIPTNEYTRTKLAGEKYIRSKALENGFKLTILRPNTIYGKNVRRNSLFDMVGNMVKKNSLITRINWPGRAALIHVDDVVKAIIYFAKHPPKSNTAQKYLLYAENLSIFEISKLIADKSGTNYKPIYIPTTVWKIVQLGRPFIAIIEKLLPAGIYNYVWRSSIIIDDSVRARTSKINRTIKNWKPKLLKDNIGDILS